MIVVSIEQCQIIIDRLIKRIIIANITIIVVAVIGIAWLVQHIDLIHRMNRLHRIGMSVAAPWFCVWMLSAIAVAATYLVASDFYAEFTYRKHIRDGK